MRSITGLIQRRFRSRWVRAGFYAAATGLTVAFTELVVGPVISSMFGLPQLPPKSLSLWMIKAVILWAFLFFSSEYLRGPDQ